MAKILYCGDCAIQTGFGRVAENVLKALATEHEVVALAVNYWGDPHDLPYRLYPAQNGGSDPFGTHRIKEVISQEKPDVVFVINDIWVANRLWEAAKPLKDELGFKWYVYFPVDSYGFFPEVFLPAQEWDGMGTYTKFGQEEVVKAGCDLPCDVIPHGIDPDNFFKLDKVESRSTFDLAPEDFIVFNGNRNQPRKRIDLTIKGFLKFAKDKPDAKLWLHMGRKDQGWDIVSLFRRVAKELDIDPKDRLVLTANEFDVTKCLPMKQLNVAYNCADVGVNTCLGEGWGLVNFEQAATGVAQIVPDHTSLKEIFSSIPRIPIESWEVDRNYGLDRGQPSPEGLASILDHYYNNREDLNKVADWCHNMTQNEVYSWDVIGKAFLQVINRTLAAPVKLPPKRKIKEA
ncbi:MAG: hypothetical protein CMK37_07815 [Porticoccaceae bacterium]|nr:hypothetical protein [Porticoccaceae bacterium]|tara:strand:- start:1457 stop:2662 length:1206 start_codon:yes stop_codon:yes gene_type:complete